MGDSRRKSPTPRAFLSRLLPGRATAILRSRRAAAIRERLPSAPGFWRSPVRGVPFTAVLGLVLLGGITVLFVTGLLSYAAYNPDLNPVNDKTPDKGLLGFYLFAWPTGPHWLYRLTQGVHVTLGIVLVPVLLAKLWSVVPKLFALPPARSLGHALERLSLLLLVGGALFEFVTGLLNIQLDYLFPGSFYRLHFYGAWVFFAAFLAHAGLRVPQAVRVLRSGGLSGTVPGDPLESPAPAAPTLSRRGALAMVGAGSLVLLITSAGRSFDGPLRRLAALTPHGAAEPGSGPNGFQINKTAASVGLTTTDMGEGWRLTVSGPAGDLRFTRDQLLAMDQHSSALPIACVEGWSTSDQWWRGVRLKDLAALAGYPDGAPGLLVESVQRSGPFRRAALRDNQVDDPRSLLALGVNGEYLSLDHGYPARIIVPAAPGVLNTKWVSRLTFGEL
ncbi:MULTISPECIES: molybdopterin-dependent oxidoreductase [unclassified Streptomyces]|uniref:molybdopterin-dependent oxidoreductase n=1 Tax=unclassified Streptomyces TaxID=2593676 RepID=UPI00081B0B9A|nr:molybdopterin-dependent oxidoreductase [Streptomyces sp. SID4936]MYQ85229.1 molybdopterin-dependent oxidoreductase [Streptomyces sp. SID4936]SCE00343.1 DMSO/TMAO reductase YedYZ, molybdopterin-dependent catalytic subunit [Streptomyces sp. DvalAA-43]